jgi:anthranilate phosphoribosyltransferase
MELKEALAQVVERRDLNHAQMTDVMNQIMTGVATPAQVGGFLVGLRMKGETVEEIAAAAQVMRDLATKVTVKFDNLVDTCGTGGDGSRLFNVSTASALVVAAAGGRVAKHGNRSVTSTAGSADVLEAAGVNLNLSPEQVARCIEELGVGFMFAPAHHGAMKHAVGPRRELGLRTIFNMLGPLTNPAGAKRQVVGVFDTKLCRVFVDVLARLGSEHVIALRSQDGLDEISLAAPTHIAELRDGEIREYTVEPSQFSIEPTSLDGLQVASAEESLRVIRDALGKRETSVGVKAADMIALNAGAAIYVAGLARDLPMAVAMAEDIIASGLAGEKLKELAELSQCFVPA